MRPILLLAVRPGGVEKASSGLSFGVNVGLKFLKIAGSEFSRFSVQFGRSPQNRDFGVQSRHTAPKFSAVWMASTNTSGGWLRCSLAGQCSF